MKCPYKFFLFVLGLLVAPAVPEAILVGRRVIAAEQGQPSVTAYPSIQAAVDANPGQVLWVPAGDYVLSDAVQIRLPDPDPDPASRAEESTGWLAPDRIHAA